MTSVAERELVTPEIKTFGEYEQRAIPVQALVVMPQVRSGMNSELGDMKESINANGLLNPIDVAVMDEFQLIDYIDFVNDLWGTEVSVESFVDKQDENGFYYLVVAGHTRTEAIRQLEAEDELGRQFAVMAKIHKISDPAEIISLQLDENLHSKPAQERQAMAIVEAYEYGRRHGRWETPSEFAKQNKGKFSRKVLKQAIGFARLPDRARDFVFSGSLSYNAAVELGDSAETILDNIAANFGFEKDQALDEHKEAAFQEAYHVQVGLLIAHIQGEGLNSTAAKKYIQGQVLLMQEKTAKLRGELDEGDSLFDMSMMSADEQANAYLAELRRQLWQEHQKIARLADSGDDILRMHTALTSLDTQEARETYQRSVKRLLGSVANSQGVQLSVQ
jgi:hypothetical protein